MSEQENIEAEVKDLAAGIEAGVAAKERLKTDPDAVRKILTGTVAVEEDVTVYPNKALNKRYADFSDRIIDLGLRTQRNEGESAEAYEERIAPAKAEYEAAVAEFEALKAELAESAVTFHLVSPGRKALKRIKRAAKEKFPAPAFGEPDLDQDDREDWYQCSVIAAHLPGYSIEDIENIADSWPQIAYAQLWSAAKRLTIADDFLGAAFDADFS